MKKPAIDSELEAGDEEAKKRHEQRLAESTAARDQTMAKVTTKADKKQTSTNQPNADKNDNDKVGEA